MISVILYGRNDNHGYNLHKRVALSLNCMAHVLTDPEDEILFVDYNTPDDYPVFPVAIADTLTPAARRLLKVFRVRADLHAQRFADRTHLKTVEPVARNVALRRSNPNNRWVLTTNTDMIFVVKQGESLSDLVAGLPPGLYCAPRFEVPETIWEDFDRSDPANVIEQVRHLGPRLHLNEIVHGADEILYDAPGDFQLMPRADLFAIDGFDEQMLLGWHIDSNISKRLQLRFGLVGDAEPWVVGYHCDHTRQATVMHAAGGPTNCLARFVSAVESDDLPAQRHTWGLADCEIESCRLHEPSGKAFRDVLLDVLPMPAPRPARVSYRVESYDAVSIHAAHVLPFLLDMFVSAPRHWQLAWVGGLANTADDALFDLFQSCWARLGFGVPITRIVQPCQQMETLDAADAIVVNFAGGAAPEDEQALLRGFWTVIYSEKRRQIGQPVKQHALLSPRRVITVNAVHNRFESVVSSVLNCTKTPFSTRLRHGYLKPGVFEYPVNWTDRMHVGTAGSRDRNGIRSQWQAGHVVFGPYQAMLRGTYVFELDVRLMGAAWRRFRYLATVNVEIVADESVVSAKAFKLKSGLQTLRIANVMLDQPLQPSVQVRLHSDGAADLRVERVWVNGTAS